MSLLQKLFRTRRVDEQFLRHSEWARRLGIPLVVALAGIKSISMMLFIILPYSLTQIAGPSTVLALIFSFLIVFFSAAHLSELSCTMPKNCVQYHFAYSVIGELPAYLVAWISLIDYIAQAGLFCKAWAEHFNLLFRGLPAKSLSFPVFSASSSILSPQIDLLTIISSVITLFLLLCSLRVVGTICVSLLAVTLLIAASCTMVAFFHSDPDNWIKAEFFHFGYQGVLYAICALCACYTGIESTSCLLEETKNPRKRIGSILSFLVLTLTTIFFILSITFSLSTNVTALSEGIMIPEVFSVINIPAAKSTSPKYWVRRFPMISSESSVSPPPMNSDAFRSYYEQGFVRMRYMLSVCSVCALSGGVLASFLPATRVIAAMCHDRLLPYARDTSTKSPYFAVLLCTILVSLCSMVQKAVLMNFVIFMAPVKMVITILLVYIQHYHPEQIGIPEETSSYKAIGKRRTRVHIDDGVSIDENSESEDVRRKKSERSDEESMVTHSSFDTTAFLYMKATKMETDRLQRRLDREEKERENEERQPVLAKSVSQYHSMDQKPRKPKHHAHNCVAEQCGVDNDDDYNSQEVHLFANEEPELPFFSTFSSTAPRPPSPDVNFSNYRRSQRLLTCFCVTTACFATYLRNFAENSPICWVLSGGFVIGVLGFVVNINRLQTNDYLYKKESKVTLFPTASLFALFLLLSAFFGSVPTKTLTHLTAIFILGAISYFLWGFRHSKHRKTACLVIENKYSDPADDQYCPILGMDTSSSSEN